MTRAPGQWTGDNEERPAPAPLDRIQSLVNTLDMEIGQDRLARADDAVPWLVANGWLTAGGAVDDADLAFLREVREALRGVLVRNADATAPDADDLAVLRGIADGATARARLDDDGTVGWRPDGDSLRNRMVDILLIMGDAQRDGTWARLKACANDECQWAFYDQSRNRGGAWCTMAICGNRLKNRDFRARHRAASH